MSDNQKYEVIWNPDSVIDLANYVRYAKTTAEVVYEKANNFDLKQMDMM